LGCASMLAVWAADTLRILSPNGKRMLGKRSDNVAAQRQGRP